MLRPENFENFSDSSNLLGWEPIIVHCRIRLAVSFQAFIHLPVFSNFFFEPSQPPRPLPFQGRLYRSIGRRLISFLA